MKMRLYQEPQRRDHMNPFGQSRGGMKIYWIVGALVVAMMTALLIV